MKRPAVSVVIPTHNRRAAVVRALDALSRQRFDGGFEVVVSIDGGEDDTRHVLGRLSLPFPLRTVASGQSRGAAAARNRGVEAASAPLIVFLDDDIEPRPGLIDAHVRGHEAGAHLTVGYLPATTTHQLDFFQVALRRWWEAMFNAMRRPGHRYTFRDVLTGNCAVDAELFHRVGGFDERFRCHEDYELGVRAIGAGASVRFVPDATGVHHERTTLPRALARKVDEGRADVAMLRKHPELITELPLGVFEQYASPFEFRLRRAVFEWPSAGRLVARALTASLAPLEAGRFRGRWRRRLNQLLQYWYWRGVRDALPTRGDFDAFREACRAASRRPVERIEVDLAQGLEGAMRTLDVQRPEAAIVRYGAQVVGDLPATAGAERLRGVHLQGALAGNLSNALLDAFARTGRIQMRRQTGRIFACGPLPTQPLAL